MVVPRYDVGTVCEWSCDPARAPLCGRKVWVQTLPVAYAAVSQSVIHILQT